MFFGKGRGQVFEGFTGLNDLLHLISEKIISPDVRWVVFDLNETLQKQILPKVVMQS